VRRSYTRRGKVIGEIGIGEIAVGQPNDAVARYGKYEICA
jgi:hypothetical protein